ncbi:MAG: hypothetical protein M3Q29_17975 [Chloroflexota bacterium]|nr:hypothetical protein [Chloroflexota bacterium]
MIPASSIPQQLRVLPQWVCWRLVPDTKGEKPRKVPYKPAGLGKASVTDTSTWGTFEQATQAANRHQHNGCGFVFSKDDDYAGIDLDNCRDPKSGELETWAAEYVEAFNTYTEISPSGRGVKLVCRGVAPHNGKNGKNGRHPGQVEMYDRERFFALTGNVLPGYSTIRSCQLQLGGLYAREWPARTEQHSAPTPPGGVVLEDHKLLERMFGGNPETQALYNWVKQPSDDESALDLSLCNHLAWWTDRKPEQMDRLFRGSALMRPKWDERRGAQTYGERTISKAIQTCHSGYDPTRQTACTKQCTESAGEECLSRDTTHNASAETDVTHVESLRAELAEARAQIRQLQSEKAGLEAKVCAQAQIIQTQRERLQSMELEAQACRSAKLKQAAPMLVAISRKVHELRARGKADEQGYCQVYVPALAEELGISRSSADRYIALGVDQGLITKRKPAPGELKEVVDQKTGEIKTVPAKEVWLGYEGAYHEHLRRIAEHDPLERPQVVKKKGASCPKHPQAPVVRFTIYKCGQCGETLAGGSELDTEVRTSYRHNDDTGQAAAAQRHSSCRQVDDVNSSTVGVVRSRHCDDTDAAQKTVEDPPFGCNSKLWGYCVQPGRCAERGRCWIDEQ